MTPSTPKRLWAIVVSAALALTGVIGVQSPGDKALALDGSRFDPGLIISDSVFYDFGSMTVEQIQRFLDSKVSNCKLSPTASFTCLRHLKVNIQAMPAVDGRCEAIEAAESVSAAQMIYTVARACNINPRVLLVTLQKEQGLVTSTNPVWPDSSKPLDYRYRIAMGYSCTDSGPCTTFGFFFQVYKAASQFRWYGNPQGSFTYLRVGKDIKIAYQVPSVSGCGARTFQLKSQATAALYYYTPYTPNQAALDNLYGTGDKCSAYGNRNFWRYYWDWFGSPIGGGFLLRSASSDVYLIVDDPATNTYEKHRISDPDLVAAFAPLGPVGTISQEYLDSFPTGSDMNRLVKSATGNYFFVEGGRKYLFSSCNQVAEVGLDCAKATQLTANQLSAMPSSGSMTVLIPETAGNKTGPQYLIQNGSKHEILDPAAVTDTGFSLPALAPVGIGAFKYLPWGAPLARDGSIFINRTNGNSAVIINQTYFEIDPATSDDLNFNSWFTPVTATLSDDGVNAIKSNVPVKSVVASTSGTQYVLTSAGRVVITTTDGLVAYPPVLPNELLTRIPVATSTLSTPLLAAAPAGKNVYLLAGQTRRLVAQSSAVSKLAAITGQTAPTVLPASAIAQVGLSGPVYAPGTLLKDASGTLYLTDGLENLFSVTSPDLAKLYGFGAETKVTKAQLASYSKWGKLSGFKVMCGTQQYLAVGGRLQPIQDDYAAAFPGKYSLLAPTTCANLKFGTTQLGRFVVSPAKLTYLLSGGKRRLVSTPKQYAALRGKTPAAFKIDSTLANLIPIGKPMAKTALTPIDAAATPTPSPSGTPTASPAPTPTATSTATPKPTPSPSMTSTPSASPSPSPTAKTYKVVSGDTLTKIAKAFGVTVTALKTANNLSTDTILVGQVLVIPQP
ncbi:MAG: LysM peptidoglycan-binding domain-containing protein [Micrococcales bacterium]